MSTRTSSGCGCGGSGCADANHGVAPMERLRWFTGRFLPAGDLTDEQNYHVGRHRLHNRLFHGTGTVCGLGVHPNDRPDCAHEWIWVDAGIAVDCLGREIVVPARKAVRWEKSAETCDGDEVAVLCVRYSECLIEPVPAIVGDCCDGKTMEASRVREGWEPEVHAVTGDPDDCWTKIARPSREAAAPCRDDCDDPIPSRDGCIEAVCECSECVPIALLRRTVDGHIRVDVDECDKPITIRRVLPPPPAFLTHIVDTSWEHGGVVDIDGLLENQGELRVRFDRRIEPGDDSRVGINAYTFLVEVEDSSRIRQRIESEEACPPRVEDECVAVFTISRTSLRARESGKNPDYKLSGNTVFVTLYTDLIHDCHGLAVDGDFFGSFPTGNGVQGGVFRSWFFLGSGD